MAGVVSVVTNLRLADLQRAVIDVKTAQIAHLEQLTYKSAYEQIAAQKALYEHRMELMNSQLQEKLDDLQRAGLSLDERARLEHEVGRLEVQSAALEAIASRMATELKYLGYTWSLQEQMDYINDHLLSDYDEVMRKVANAPRHPTAVSSDKQSS